MDFNPYVIGGFYGLYIGGYWIGRDYMEIISTEMVPTDIRASIIGAEGLLVYAGMAVGFAFVNIGILFMPIWLTCLIFAVPCVAISVVLLLLKVKETTSASAQVIYCRRTARHHLCAAALGCFRHFACPSAARHRCSHDKGCLSGL